MWWCCVLNMVLFAHISWREISAATLMRDYCEWDFMYRFWCLQHLKISVTSVLLGNTKEPVLTTTIDSESCGLAGVSTDFWWRINSDLYFYDILHTQIWQRKLVASKEISVKESFKAFKCGIHCQVKAPFFCLQFIKWTHSLQLSKAADWCKRK